ncbi:hypothetical protein, partial [Klebsiella pneumoniae]|uniref:hypothetical protein n=1 Tax=Klebsiella pneumoniae TaxID=573 RepID=UPI0025A1BC8B
MHKNHSEIQNESKIRRRYSILMLVMVIILFAVVILSFWVGYYPLSPVQVIEAFLSKFGYQGEILPQAVTIF